MVASLYYQSANKSKDAHSSKAAKDPPKPTTGPGGSVVYRTASGIINGGATRERGTSLGGFGGQSPVRDEEAAALLSGAPTGEQR